ncbi:3',5'-cyclic-AMP phosphodiesterase [Candidatus Synechococcus calcipolaris G9]|uniref:3',5'-cyclic-AMP phosphodiesterase n=1 Tax=Candidatus Synechococcus calcipolaris G9 TaxID=1497997 RepID=A0ABT6EXK2_9SYNE|nr:3',5'-cyclic-AMP phosphodiesterase [Candidatus Synechococcus calcipolaris]MDG2990534.1 3',5'-cyclic-AMP phosphodiesterase [Candidatus Synechococcus calcipolaris G9]
MAAPIHIVQISDLHLFGDRHGQLLGLETAASFQGVLQQIKELYPLPDLFLLTGDLAQDHSAAAYRYLWQCLSPFQRPTYWIPGNHDDISLMGVELTQSPFNSLKSFTVGDWRILLLNSQVTGSVYGQLSPATLGQLAQDLGQAPDQPTLLALHHPPFQVGAHWLDGSRLRNPEELFALLDQHPQVKLVIFGHIHQAFHHQRHGVHYFGTPSTCIQFRPQSNDFSLDTCDPGFRQLWLFADGRFETEITRVPMALSMDRTATGY